MEKHSQSTTAISTLASRPLSQPPFAQPKLPVPSHPPPFQKPKPNESNIEIHRQINTEISAKYLQPSGPLQPF